MQVAIGQFSQCLLGDARDGTAASSTREIITREKAMVLKSILIDAQDNRDYTVVFAVNGRRFGDEGIL